MSVFVKFAFTQNMINFIFEGIHWLRNSLGWKEKEVQCPLQPSPYGTSCYQKVCMGMFLLD